MEEVLSNQWIIGIVVGVVSGLILYPITKFLNSKFSKKEYYKKLGFANNEMKSYIVNAISEGNHLHIEIIKTLKASISRKYEVSEDDMLTINEILEDVIRIIFDTNFISIESKIKSSDTLLKIKVQSEVNEDNATPASFYGQVGNKSIQFRTTFPMTILGTLLPISLILVMFNEISPLRIYNDEIIRVLMISILALSVTYGLLTVHRIKKTKKNNKEYQEAVKRKLEEIRNNNINL